MNLYHTLKRYPILEFELFVRSSIPGRIRIQCEFIRRDDAALFIETHCINDTNIFNITIHRITGTILIFYNPNAYCEKQIYYLIYDILYKYIHKNEEFSENRTFKMTLEHTALISSVISDFFIPAFVPISAITLTVLCVPNLRNILEELKMRRIGLSSLYFTILIATVASGSFFSAALMGWFFRFWDNKTRRENHKFYCYFLSHINNTIKSCTINRICDSKHTIYLSEILKRSFAITQRQRLVFYGQNFANRAVLPTLLASGCGVMIGDLTMTLAILRPDYATAAGMIGVSGAFHDFKTMLNYDIIISDFKLSEKCLDSNLLIIEFEDKWVRDENIHGFLESISRIREICPEIQIVIMGNFTSDIIDHVLSHFDAKSIINTSSIDPQHYELNLPEETRVVLVGNIFWKISGNPQSITRIGTKLSDIDYDKMKHYSAFLLRHEHEMIAKIWAISDRRRSIQKKLHQYIYIPNIYCVAGAFLWGFTSLTAVLITNLASWNMFRISRFWKFRQKMSFDTSIPYKNMAFESLSER